MSPDSTERELGAALYAALEELGAPANVASLRRELAASLQQPPQVLRRVLDALVTHKQLFAVGPASARYYSTRDPSEAAARAVVNALRDKPRTRAELERLLKADAPWIGKLDPLLTQLVAAGQVFALPQLRQGLPTKAVAKYALQPAAPPSADKFLESTVRELEKAARKAEPHGISIRVLLDELRRRFDRQLSDAAPQPTASASDVQRTFAALQELSSRDPNAVLFPMRQLRAQLDIDKSRFDSAVLTLSRDGRVILHHHDFPGSLSESERDKLVVDSNGTHFVGIALGVVS